MFYAVLFIILTVAQAAPSPEEGSFVQTSPSPECYKTYAGIDITTYYPKDDSSMSPEEVAHECFMRRMRARIVRDLGNSKEKMSNSTQVIISLLLEIDRQMFMRGEAEDKFLASQELTMGHWENTINGMCGGIDAGAVWTLAAVSSITILLLSIICMTIGVEMHRARRRDGYTQISGSN